MSINMCNNIRYYGLNEENLKLLMKNFDIVSEINNKQTDNMYCGITKLDILKNYHLTQLTKQKNNKSKHKLGCCIYIISTEKLAKKNNYKIGRHSGSISKLKTRYRTYLINPEIYYLKYVDDYEIIESKIKNLVKKYIINDSNGKKTEWVNIKLSKLKIIIDEIILNHRKKINEETSSEEENN
ncbi:hypothetical protein [Saudi moumouvirus]|nr:hypothetical protein [Saudi moumouvirus]